MMTAQPAPGRVPLLRFLAVSLFWPEIYSEPHPVRRRNTGLPMIGPWKKQWKQPLFSAVFGETIRRRDPRYVKACSIGREIDQQ
jgi:hypothetical protein